MAETTVGIIIHYLEAIVAKAKLTGFDELRVEIESVAADEAKDAAAAERILKRVLDTLGLHGGFSEDQLIAKVSAIIQRDAETIQLLQAQVNHGVLADIPSGQERKRIVMTVDVDVERLLDRRGGVGRSGSVRRMLRDELIASLDDVGVTVVLLEVTQA